MSQQFGIYKLDPGVQDYYIMLWPFPTNLDIRSKVTTVAGPFDTYAEAEAAVPRKGMDVAEFLFQVGPSLGHSDGD